MTVLSREMTRVLTHAQEAELARAVVLAYDLDIPLLDRRTRRVSPISPGATKSDVLRLQPTPWFDTCRQPGGRPVSDGPTVARSGSSECVSERKRAMPDLAYGRVHAEPTRA